MPKFLPPAARREFRFLCRGLGERGLLSVVDGAAPAGYCFAYARQIRHSETPLRPVDLKRSPKGARDSAGSGH